MAVIDPNGQTWARPEDLAWHAYGETILATQRSEKMLLSGCIEVDLSPSLSRIRLSPSQLTTQAYMTLDGLLEAAQPMRIYLSWQHHQKWHDEISPNATSVRKRLLNLACACKSHPNFFSQTYDTHDILVSDPHAPIADLWRTTSGAIDLRKHSDYITSRIGRFLTAYVDDGTIRFGMFGPDWKIYKSRNWLTDCVGQSVEDQPDVEYGAWVAGNYNDLMSISAPAAYLNDVTVTDPTGDGSKRLQYKRLNVPVIGYTGRHELLIVSYNDPSIDLRPPMTQM